MNLPNRLSILRIIMVPVFAVLYYLTAIPYNFAVSAAIFALAALTDFLDGFIARKYNLVTDLGKFLDPIADKTLVSTALILLLVPPEGTVVLPWYAGIMVAVIIARELIISGLRLVAAGKGMVISADTAGKIKTFFTDISIIAILVSAEISPEIFGVENTIGTVLLAVSTLLTVISGAECIVKNRAVLKTPEKKPDTQIGK